MAGGAKYGGEEYKKAFFLSFARTFQLQSLTGRTDGQGVLSRFLSILYRRFSFSFSLLLWDGEGIERLAKGACFEL